MTETAEPSAPLALSIAEAAQQLGVSPRTIAYMIDDGRLRASRIVARAGSRGRVVIHVASLKTLLDATEVKATLKRRHLVEIGDGL
jgi:excisionase family DNA binding protein